MIQPVSSTVMKLTIAFAIVTLSCSILSTPPSPAESEYRYDDLPEANNTDAAIAEYQAISQWNKLEIAYFFINGTEKLSDESEREAVRQALPCGRGKRLSALPKCSTARRRIL